MRTDLLTPRDVAAVTEFAERVRAQLGETVIGLRLFASKARGDAREDSDIDVAVIVSRDRLAAEDAVIDVAFDVNLAHDVYISPGHPRGRPRASRLAHHALRANA